MHGRWYLAQISRPKRQLRSLNAAGGRSIRRFPTFPPKQGNFFILTPGRFCDILVAKETKMFIVKLLIAVVAICALAPTQAAATSKKMGKYENEDHDEAVCSGKCVQEYNNCESACRSVNRYFFLSCDETCRMNYSFCQIMMCNAEYKYIYSLFESPAVFWQEMCSLTCKWRQKYRQRKYHYKQ